MSRIVPRSLKFSGAVVSRTLGKAVMPSSLKLFKGARITGALLFSFVMVSVAVLLLDSVMHLMFVVVDLILVAVIFFVIRMEVMEIARHVNYSNIGVGVNDREPVVDLITGMITGAVFSVALIVATWTYMWQFSLMVVMVYAAFTVLLMRWAYAKLYVEGAEIPIKVYHIPSPGEDDEEIPDVPKPVYGVAKTLPKNMRL
jgi:hypothetical protein